MLLCSLLQETDTWIHWTNTKKKKTHTQKSSAEIVQWIREISAKHFKLPCGIAARTHSLDEGRCVGEGGQIDSVGAGRKAAEIIPHPATLSQCGSSDPEFWRWWTTKEREEKEQHSEDRWLDWIHQLNVLTIWCEINFTESLPCSPTSSPMFSEPVCFQKLL